jgi:hypothetical protein
LCRMAQPLIAPSTPFLSSGNAAAVDSVSINTYS